METRALTAEQGYAAVTPQGRQTTHVAVSPLSEPSSIPPLPFLMVLAMPPTHPSTPVPPPCRIQELLTHQRRAQQLVEQMVVSQRAVQAENARLHTQANSQAAAQATDEVAPLPSLCQASFIPLCQAASHSRHKASFPLRPDLLPRFITLFCKMAPHFGFLVCRSTAMRLHRPASSRTPCPSACQVLPNVAARAASNSSAQRPAGASR